MLSGAKACTSYRSRQELPNEYLLAKFGFDTASQPKTNSCNSASSVSLFTYLFVPLWYSQFLRIVRFTSQPAENGPLKVYEKFARKTSKKKRKKDFKVRKNIGDAGARG